RRAGGYVGEGDGKAYQRNEALGQWHSEFVGSPARPYSLTRGADHDGSEVEARWSTVFEPVARQCDGVPDSGRQSDGAIGSQANRGKTFGGPVRPAAGADQAQAPRFR